MSDRKIFRTLVDLEEGRERLLKHFVPKPVGIEEISASMAYRRIIAEDIFSPIDVPSFDRAAMDGFAAKASDTFGAEEDRPVTLRVLGKVEAGEKPMIEVGPGETVEIATGAPLPRGADSVVMVEYTERKGNTVAFFRSVSPGENTMSAGADIMQGELVLRRGQVITYREMGLLGALGLKTVKVFRKPRVGIISTGNELIEAGHRLEFGKIYDTNSYSLIGAVIDSGGEPVFYGIATDNREDMKQKICNAVQECDVVLTSGSTSAGVGDLLYRIIDELGKPGIIVHGLSVKPGKPAIIAVVSNKPVFGLPGYPTSAIMIYDGVARPVIQQMSGHLARDSSAQIEGSTAVRIYSSKGRREFLTVNVVRDEKGQVWVYPTLTGSGAITTFALSDGYIDVPEGREFIEEGEPVRVQLFSTEIKPPDLVIIGSHCVGVDILLSCLSDAGIQYTMKIINVGSIGGLNAIKRNEADIAGVHLLDAETGRYNEPFVQKYGLKEASVIVKGYLREQGFIQRKDSRHKIHSFEDLVDSDLVFINRTRGSGTRLLLEEKLKAVADARKLTFEEIIKKINGYAIEARTHSAVAAAVRYGRADVGVGIKSVAEAYGLDFEPIISEEYDFVVRRNSMNKDAAQGFFKTLRSDVFRDRLTKQAPGFSITSETGKTV